jgi:hypothetical protein
MGKEFTHVLRLLFFGIWFLIMFSIIAWCMGESIRCIDSMIIGVLGGLLADIVRLERKVGIR